MEARAHWKFARISTIKARAMADRIRGKVVSEAMETLQMVPRKTARYWTRVIDSAVANLRVLRNREDVDLDLVFLKEIKADEGPSWKRWLPRAMGRATRINKVTSHLSVTVADE